MKRFAKIYLEISNICNLQCAFCPGTRRTPKILQAPDLEVLLPKIRPWTDYLYFHIMGEPLCHPQLKTFLEIAGNFGFKVIITTNGTLLAKQQDVLLNASALHKVNVSLHAFEANDLSISFAEYIYRCIAYAKAAEGKKITVFRLWNQGGADQRNEEIIAMLKASFPSEWVRNRHGFSLGSKVYLEYGDKFDWPDLNAHDYGEQVFCYGLRDQIGVLCDGTVVPCCLDHEGDIALGNLFMQDLEEIINSPRAKAIYNGFSGSKATEALCRRCGYAQRFKK